MRQLDRKLIRDLLQMKSQALAISLVIACGVAMFVMSLTTLDSLSFTRDTFYERYRFAHVFAPLKRAPQTLAVRIAEIAGVAQVQTRIVVDVTLDVPGLAEPAVGRLNSIPEVRTPGLNELHLREGRYIEPGRKGEVLASEGFAQAHGFQPGDQLQAVINGRRQTLTIVGIALSPEYVFQMRGGDLLPDDKRYGVFWMSEIELEAAFDMQEAFNHASLTLMHGASEPEVIAQLDRLLEPYGSIGAYGRHDHVSARYLAEEIKQLKNMGVVTPIIFLGVASFLLNVVLSRLVSTQRDQIAALKAFGYTRFDIGVHYLKFVVLITLVGYLIGVIGGARLGQGMTKMYTQFYRFPVFYYRFSLAVASIGLFISILGAATGTLSTLWRAMLLPPAEAMRPEPPATFRPTIIERIGLQQLFSQTARMVLRQLERRPMKSLLSAFGISLAVAVLVLGNFMLDAMDYLIQFQFFIAQRHNVSLTFVEPTTARARFELEHLPGVLQVETFRSVPVRLRAGHRSRRVGIMGLQDRRDLFRLIDANEKLVNLPNDGLLISDKLAELLGVSLGDPVIVQVLEGKRPEQVLPVSGMIRDFSGTNAYMNVDAIHRLMQEGGAISGAYLSADRSRLDELYAQLKSTPKVAGVTVRDAALESFRKTIAENQLKMQSFNILFACVIAFGVVYNTARISLSERSRELATLRVIGFTRAEISSILLGELAILTLAAIPLGMGIGYAFAALSVWAFESELFRIPLVVNPSTFAFAAVVVMLAAVISGLVVRRRLDSLDLVSVLKSKE